ncbi:MAG: hypothetical protein KC413_01580 [Anaerolineales bacterium]|nr:hypothetical protein [Anaerolineales bacterium]MCA9974403.1 hypothetical protein [Anaerolineales bacterium]
MAQPNVKKQAKCPACGATIALPSTLKEGQVIECSSCDAKLEVISADPVELDWAFEDDDYEYDYEDDGYEYDEDDEYDEEDDEYGYDDDEDDDDYDD